MFCVGPGVRGVPVQYVESGRTLLVDVVWEWRVVVETEVDSRSGGET